MCRRVGVGGPRLLLSHPVGHRLEVARVPVVLGLLPHAQQVERGVGGDVLVLARHRAAGWKNLNICYYRLAHFLSKPVCVTRYRRPGGDCVY